MEQARYLLLSIPEWITIMAIVAGPIIAVWVTRYHDNRTKKKSNQLDVFRALMKTRRARLDSEHVAALNLIEIEFYNNLNIMNKHSAYAEHLTRDLPPENKQDAFFAERGALFVALLQAIGTEVGYHFDKLDLDRSGYFPVGWEVDQEREKRNAIMISELLEGRRSLPIVQLQYDQTQFPPKP